MKKQKLLFTTLMALILMFVPQQTWAAGTKPSLGNGSASDPYQIGTEDELIWFRDAVNGTNAGTGTGTGICAKLIGDIEVLRWLKPIGNKEKPYCGTFDGQKHTIKLNSGVNNEDDGLFGYISGATIQNFTLTGTRTINSTTNFGSVVGTATGNSNIYNVHSSVTIWGSGQMSHVGGIVGQILKSEGTTKIKGCTFSGKVNLPIPTNIFIGGIVSYCEKNAKVEIEYCSFTGDMTTNPNPYCVGGILGYANDDATISNFNYIQKCFVQVPRSLRTGTYVGILAGHPEGNVLYAIKDNTYISDNINKALGGNVKDNLEKNNKAITVSAKCSNESYGTVDIAYVDPVYSTSKPLNSKYAHVKLTVTCTDPYEYLFSKWNDGNTSNPRSVALTDNIDLTATITRTHYDVTLSTSPEGIATVKGEGRYEAGAKVTIEAERNYKEWTFQRWSDGVEEPSRTLTMDRDYDLTAEYVKIRTQSNVIAKPDSDEHGTVTGGALYQIGTQQTIEAIPNANYHFEKWSDENTDNPRTIEVKLDDNEYTAIFAPHTYDDNWTISNDATCTETGEKYRKCTFDGCDGTETETIPAGHQWDENGVCTVCHKLNAFPVIVKSNNDDYGQVEGGGEFVYQSNQIIKATPKFGYHFVKWSDGNTENPRTIEVKAEDNEFTAIFAPHTFNDWTVKTVQTCTTSETKHRTCTFEGCNEEETEETLPALGHGQYEFTFKWEGDYQNATFTYSLICNKCNQKVVDNESVATHIVHEHHMDPTYMNEGREVWSTDSIIYDHEGDIYFIQEPLRYQFNIPMLDEDPCVEGHGSKGFTFYGEFYRWREDVTPKYYYYLKCKACNSFVIETTEANVHEINELHKAPTCQELGSETWETDSIRYYQDDKLIFVKESQRMVYDLNTIDHQYDDNGECIWCHKMNGMLANGTSGTCKWYITDNNKLVIEPIDGKSGVLDSTDSSNHVPWYKDRDKIQTVEFHGEVTAQTCKGMFESCYNMYSADLANLNTEIVFNMDDMFNGCTVLKTLKLGKDFSMINVVTKKNMFKNCGGNYWNELPEEEKGIIYYTKSQEERDALSKGTDMVNMKFADPREFNIYSASALSNIILKGECTDDELEIYDLDKDGKITIKDLVKLIDQLKGNVE